MTAKKRCGYFTALGLGDKRRMAASTLLVALLCVPPLSAQEGPGVTVTPFGNPTWEPVDFHLFSAPLGSFESNFAEAVQTQQATLPAPNHQLISNLGIGPGVAHPAPYDTELGTGVQNAGFVEKTVFEAAEFQPPQGVFLVWMTVPTETAAPGTDPAVPDSPDYEHGPIIANSLFPFLGRFEVRRDGELFEPIATDIPVAIALDNTLDPPFNVEGHSHFPFYFADSTIFANPINQPIPGEYQYNVRMTDQGGNGYDMSATFTIVPEPGSMLLASTGLLAMMGVCRRRNRAG